MTVNFRATQDYILVLPAERKQSDVLHVVSNEKYTQGTVIVVGPGKKDKKGRIRELTVKPGDFITYGDINRGYDFYPTYIEGGVIYRILQEADIAFIVEPDATQNTFTDSEIAGMVSDARTLHIGEAPKSILESLDGART